MSHLRPSRSAAIAIFHRLAPARLGIAAALAFLLPLLLYLPALRFGFVILDDPSFIAANPLVTGGLRFSALRDAFLVPVPAAPMYIPLLWVSYMLDVSLFGNHPWAFHLTNILLHATSSLLLFLLLRRLTCRFSRMGSSSPPLATPFLLALLWALHPLRIESVVWAAERKDCLAVFFCLLTIHAWLSFLVTVGAPRCFAHVFAAFLFFALGLLSKPSLVPLPLFLAVLWALRPPPPPLHDVRGTSSMPPILRTAFVLAPFFLLAALASIATASFHARHATLAPPPFLSRLATIPSVFLFYLSKTFVPRHLSILYPQWTSPIWLGVLLSIPFLAAALWLFRRRRVHPLPFLGSAFAFIFLLPVSGLLPVSYNLVADRYSLLPAIGLSIALLEFVPPSVDGESSRRRGLFAVALAILVSACAVATSLHLPTWRDTESLFLPARRLLPDHFSIRGFDAAMSTRHGDFAASSTCIARAARIFPDASLLLDNVPNVYALKGPRSALDYLFAHLPPDSVRSRWSVLVAAIQLELDRPADALASVSSALASSPPSDPYRNILLQTAAIASFRLGDISSALSFARRAGIISPDADTLVPGHFINGYLFFWNNNLKAPALHYFRELAESDPTPSVLNNIAWILASSLWSPAPPSEAIALARRALDAIPSDSPLRPTLLDSLSVALANASDFPSAIDAISGAIDLLPPSSPALPSMRSRLALYRQSLPYREFLGSPIPPSKYTFDPHL